MAKTTAPRKEDGPTCETCETKKGVELPKCLHLRFSRVRTRRWNRLQAPNGGEQFLCAGPARPAPPPPSPDPSIQVAALFSAKVTKALLSYHAAA